MRKPLFLFIGLLLLLASCANQTASDQAAVVYEGHVAGVAKFDGCLQPLQRKSDDGNDNAFYYPAGQRTFKFDSKPNDWNTKEDDADAPALTIVTSDTTTMYVEGVATFSLNTDCATLRQFHERVGLKYQQQYGTDTLDQWWTPLLSTYIRQPLDRALDQEGKKFTMLQLYTTAEAKEAWEKAVGKLTPQLVNELGGARFFCGPNDTPPTCGDFLLNLQNPTPPPNVVAARNDKQAAIAQNDAQKERNAAVATELQSIRQIVGVLGPDGYIAYKALKMAEEGKNPPTVFIPQGGRANVNPRTQ